MPRKKNDKIPAEQGIPAGDVGYMKPPSEHRFPPGQSGNPSGRPSAGTTIKEWINQYAEAGLTDQELRKIARDRTLPWPKRAAAERIIRTLEAGDIADFAGLLSGENNLEDLRGMGINTEVIKKLKQKTRKVSVGNGDVEELVEREIELYDRAGTDFDRIMDQTVGRPKQQLDLTSGDKPLSESQSLMKVIFANPEAHAALGLIADQVKAAKSDDAGRKTS